MKESVSAIIFNASKNQVLLIKRRDVPVWVLPGGGLDSNEAPENGILREAFEETGLSVKIVRKVAVYHPINHLTHKTHLFECEATDGSPQKGTETAAIGFFSFNALPKGLFHIHYDMIQDTLGNSNYFEKKLNKVTYWELFKFFLKHPLLVLRFALSKAGLPCNSKE